MSEKRFTFGAVSPNVAMIKDNGEPMKNWNKSADNILQRI